MVQIYSEKNKGKFFIGVVITILFLLSLGVFLASSNPTGTETQQVSVPIQQIAGSFNQALGCTSGTNFELFGPTDVTYEYSSNLYKNVISGKASITGHSSDCIAILWDKTELNSVLVDDGVQVSNSVIGGMSLNEQTQKFSPSSTKESIYKINYTDIGFWTTCNDAKCISLYPNAPFVTAYATLLHKCYCFYGEKIGDYSSTLESSYKGFKATFEIEGSNPIQLTESSMSYKSSDGRVFIHYTGDLMGNTWLGNPAYDWYKPTAGSSIYMVKDGANSILYSLYNTQINAIRDCNIYTDFERFSCAKGYADAYNNQIPTQLDDKTDDWRSSNPVIRSYTKSGDSIIAYLEPSAITYPTFDFELDADWVGIVHQCSTPEMICPLSQTINPSEQKTISFNVKNTDTHNSASFALAMSCTPTDAIGFALTSSSTGDIGPLQTKTATAIMNGLAINSDVSGSCFLKAYSLNCPERYDTCNFDVTIIAGHCIPGQTTCSTNSDGTYKLATCNLLGNFEFNNCTKGYKCASVGSTYSCQSSCVTSADCQDSYICSDSKCILPSNATGCSSCFSWLFGNKLKSEPTCTAKLLMGSDTCKWYDVTCKLTPKISQDAVCPWFLLGVGIIIAVFLLIFVVIIALFRRNRGGYTQRNSPSSSSRSGCKYGRSRDTGRCKKRVY